jgi:flagellin
MSLTINTNLEAMGAQRNLQNTENALSSTMAHLSSGLRINSAADDVAGYAIDQRLQGQVNGVTQATQNSQDAVSLVQTAQGALNDVQQMLQRMRELAVQYANGTNTETDKEAIKSEAKELESEITRVGETTKFNGVALLAEEKKIAFQVGANEKETIEVGTVKLSEAVKGISVEKIESIDTAINEVSKAAAGFGSVQDRLQYTQSNLAIYGENLSSAQSALQDANMAAEMTNFTKNQVLVQAGVSILAQANSLPQAVLKLLG